MGGGELKGKLVGGERNGETVQVVTPALGPLTVRVDRLRGVVFRARAPLAGPGAFRLPDGTKEKEAVFRTARRGFDTILGGVVRFTADGVLFEPSREAHRLFRYRDLAGYALRGGDGPQKPGSVQLITTSGDVLQVRLLRVADGKLWVRAEGLELADRLQSAKGRFEILTGYSIAQ